MLPKFLRRKPATEPEPARPALVLPVTDEPAYLPEPAPDSLEMALPIRQLAALFVANGWVLSLDGKTLEDPSPENVGSLIAALIDDMINDPEMFYSTATRLMAIRDPSYLTDVDIYLYLGRAHTSIEGE